ncbi:HlyD family secretion protein [Parabacteroides pacaensis]|uniref:HlyD family secretion protein n=1 Tax=Parabacteroides pacaensis TaxID=2086575 RepID=UPI000D0FBFF6|nr:HlyD family efflux transporter periplasmic adaptor subunit [Parabacteroides pacaensis]
MEEEKDIELRSSDFEDVLGAVPPWILRRGILVVASIVLILIIGSAIFKYPDTIVSTVTLTGSNPATGVVARSSGKIAELYVNDNQKVMKGDYLAIIENPADRKDVLYLKEYLSFMNGSIDSVLSLPLKNINVGTLQSRYSSFYLALSEYFQFRDLQYYPKKIELMKARIKKNEIQYHNITRQRILVEKQLGLVRNQFQRDSLLHVKGILSNEEFESTYSQYLQSCISLENMDSNIENLRIQITQLKESLLDTEYQYQEKKNTLQIQVQSLIAELQTEIQAWELNFVLVSPVTGKITFTNFWVENQNVIAGENVFNIVPEEKGEILGKALLPVNRSGKVKVGQKVNIRFDNFPDTEFGIVRGYVQNISLVPSKKVESTDYIVEIELPHGLETTYKKELPYQPEMTGRADIITEDISILSRILLPIKKIITESL